MASTNQENKINTQEQSLSISLIIDNLKRYPSGDNAQPFKFVFDEENLRILVVHDSQLASHLLNPQNLSSIITLGMILEMMELLSQYYSFTYSSLTIDAEVSLNAKKVASWLEFSDFKFLRPIETNFFKLVRTCRGHYQMKDIPFVELDPGVFVVKDIDKKAADEMSLAESCLWENKNVIRDVLNWVRLSRKIYQEMRSGFYYKEINVNIFEVPILFLLKCRRILKYFPLKIIQFFYYLKLKKLHRSTKNYLCFTGEISGIESLIKLGRIVYRTKYKLALDGIATHPLSLLTFPYLFHINFNQNVLFTYDFTKIQRIFLEKTGSRQQVLWILRVGYSKGKAEISLRK